MGVIELEQWAKGKPAIEGSRICPVFSTRSELKDGVICCQVSNQFFDSRMNEGLFIAS